VSTCPSQELWSANTIILFEYLAELIANPNYLLDGRKPARMRQFCYENKAKTIFLRKITKTKLILASEITFFSVPLTLRASNLPQGEV
jgi:hypothetical protein